MIEKNCLNCNKKIIVNHKNTKYCSICCRKKFLENKRISTKKWCENNKEENKKRHKIYSLKNKDKINEKTKKWNKEIRKNILIKYGNKCNCCKENKYEFLAIDHINNDGVKHRKEIGRKNIYYWLKKNNYPKENFQVLCHNCNMAKGFYGYCPHNIK